MAAISGATIFTQPSNGSAEASWLGSAWNSIQANASSNGILGALQSSASNNGSVSSFLSSTQTFADAFSTITLNNYSGLTTLAQQKGTDAQQQAQTAQLNALSAASSTPPPPPGPTLNTMIYFDNGSTLDTVNNILTMSDGTQIDSTTGIAIPSKDILQLGNGAYLDMDKDIMTLADGTRIDTLTGQTIAVSA